MPNEKTAPTTAYEFVMTQLILRSFGIRTSEMAVIIETKDEQSTTIDLKVTQGKQSEVISIGLVKLAASKVNKMWTYWTEVAADEILKDFDTHKERSHVFKCVDVLVSHLIKLGFVLSDTPILETHDVDIVH